MRKAVSILICLVMLLSLATTACAAEFGYTEVSLSAERTEKGVRLRLSLTEPVEHIFLSVYQSDGKMIGIVSDPNIDSSGTAVIPCDAQSATLAKLFLLDENYRPVSNAVEVEIHDMVDKQTLNLAINGDPVNVIWEDNESVNALQALVKEAPLTIQMSMYGGFEQVGSIGTSLPRNDEQTTTEAGDIVLYSGNQIVVFYGSNSWTYTRLGKIVDKTATEMEELLGNGNVTITLSME